MADPADEPHTNGHLPPDLDRITARMETVAVPTKATRLVKLERSPHVR